MKITVKIQSGSQASEHTMEIPAWRQTQAASGFVEFLMDDDSAAAAWTEVEPGVYSFLMNGRSYAASVWREPAKAICSPGVANHHRYQSCVAGRLLELEFEDARSRRRFASRSGHSGPFEIMAPMPGRIVKILVPENGEVAQGGGLMVIEAMKMQNEIRAPRSGHVAKIYVQEGEGVESGARLLSFE